METYKKLYARSIEDNEGFWREAALEHLDWFHPFDTVTSGSFQSGDIAWFLNGKLNVSYNCLDRHLKKHANKVALLWEGDEESDTRSITYLELYQQGEQPLHLSAMPSQQALLLACYTCFHV